MTLRSSVVSNPSNITFTFLQVEIRYQSVMRTHLLQQYKQLAVNVHISDSPYFRPYNYQNQTTVDKTSHRLFAMEFRTDIIEVYALYSEKNVENDRQYCMHCKCWRRGPICSSSCLPKYHCTYKDYSHMSIKSI